MSLTEQEKLGVTLFHKRKELSLLQGEVALMVGVEKPLCSTKKPARLNTSTLTQRTLQSKRRSLQRVARLILQPVKSSRQKKLKQA